MNRIVILIVGLSLTYVLFSAAEPTADQAKTITEIQKVGGKVTVDEKNRNNPAIKTDVRQELVELKQLLSGLSARLEKIERRLSRLEKRLPGEPTTHLRSLNNHLTVDEHGIIWDRGKPGRVWGVNGGDE